MLTSPTPALQISDGHFAFGARDVLRGLSLELFPGELLGLLGPNGAGKTTLIRCVAGRLELAQGKIAFGNSDQSRVARSQSSTLGIVPQEIALYPDLTVKQNLKAFGELQGVTGRELRERISSTLEWAKLADRRNSLTKSLSGGMQRRLNIACSILHNPEIVLLDEPTVGVDPQSRESIYSMLEDLLQAGTAVLLTTHHLEEAQQRCDRIAIMDGGKILATGSLDELFEHTIGNHQQVEFRFRVPPNQFPESLDSTEDGLEAWGFIQDPNRDLPELLFQLRRHRGEIESLAIREPSLQQMFLHLTGKELRE